MQSSKKTKELIPKGIRHIIYSFLTIIDLLNKIGKVSKTERLIIISDSEIINQPRCLKIKFCPRIMINYQ